MKKRDENRYLPGWQILEYPGSELDYDQENDRSEEEEYSFYSFVGDDHKDRVKMIKVNEKSIKSYRNRFFNGKGHEC
jgi:hypothetical protein